MGTPTFVPATGRTCRVIVHAFRSDLNVMAKHTLSKQIQSHTKKSSTGTIEGSATIASTDSESLQYQLHLRAVSTSGPGRHSHQA